LNTRLVDFIKESVENNYNVFPLSSLVIFARQFKDFKEFSKWYSMELNHGYYWHITHNKDFTISDFIAPRDMSSMAGGMVNDANKGNLMITGDLLFWDDYYNILPFSTTKKISRGYAVLFDASALDPSALKQVSRGFGNEIYLYKEDAQKLRIIGVYPREYARRLYHKFANMIPQSEKTLYDLWLFANKKEI